ncbi:MAG: uncharacterized protein H6R10_1102 [Rhodocyclaceae bacterium]|nr:uncharacterized protein [Rhodocyclaceae bacterium]
MHCQPVSSFPIVLFGAFDRHNFGDLLLGQAAALAAAPRPCLFAGLRAADLTAWGGFAVEPLGQVVAGWRQRFGEAPLDLVHVGGEILDTDAWEAAVMLLDPQAAQAAIARLDGNPRGRADWAAAFLATGRPAPYVIGRDQLPAGGRLEFRAVGGVGLAQRNPAFARAVAAALGAADTVTVRDQRTRRALAALGVTAGLVPDPVTTLGPWLAEQIAAVPILPGDYVAFQCAATFGDDGSLAALAAAFDRIGLPVLAFRAGAAPWHDDRAVYERLSRRMRVPFGILDSLHVRDIAATVARSRLCLASSLHALLVAQVSGVPAVGLERRSGEGAKLRAYAETWNGFRVVTPEELAADGRSQETL